MKNKMEIYVRYKKCDGWLGRRISCIAYCVFWTFWTIMTYHQKYPNSCKKCRNRPGYKYQQNHPYQWISKIRSHCVCNIIYIDVVLCDISYCVDWYILAYLMLLSFRVLFFIVTWPSWREFWTQRLL